MTQSQTLSLDETVIPSTPIDAPALVVDVGQPTFLDAESELEIPPAEPHANFWHHEDTGTSKMNAPAGVFIHEVYVAKKVESDTPYIVLGVLLIAVVGGFVWNSKINHESPFATLTHLFHLLSGTEENVRIVVANKSPKLPQQLPVEDVVAPLIKRMPAPAGQTIENPYLHLINQLSEKPPRRTEVLKAKQENEWRAGLEHQFYYQRYKTVLEIVAARKYGSEALLRDALQFGKFWMRMAAVVGLADMGYEVKAEDIKMALGDAHRELRARYFARFEQGPCGVGCQLVARGAMSELDASGRLQILRVIASDTSAVTGDYMVAATFDSDLQVRDYATNWLLKNPVEETEWWRVYELIKGSPSSVPGSAI